MVLLIMNFRHAPCVFLNRYILVLRRLRVVGDLFRVLPRLLLQRATFMDVSDGTRRGRVPVPTLCLSSLPRPPVMRHVQVVAVRLSNGVPLLTSFLTSRGGALVPLQVYLPHLDSYRFK